MLRPDDLGQVLQVATASGISIDYVETNSSWFKDIESAEAVLTMLRQKGLRTLLVSISPFHNEFIPFYKVQGVIEACHNSGIQVFPWIADFVKDLNQFDTKKPHAVETFENAFGKDYLVAVLDPHGREGSGHVSSCFKAMVSPTDS